VREQLGAVDSGPPVLHLYEGHLPAFNVYRSCQWRLLPVQHGHGTRWVYLGIDAVEIEAAARLVGIERRRRAEVFRQVRIMAAAAAEVLNEVRR
jgi:hypothetical protein